MRPAVRVPLLVLSLAVMTRAADEKTYEGKTLQAWLAQLQDKEPKQSLAAIDALLKVGPPAVPALGDALKGKEAALRRNAAYVLGELGPDAKDAVGALADALRDEDAGTRQYAAAALGRIGPDASAATPGLVAALQG